MPIPDHAAPGPLGDAHMALVDYQARKAWDMFLVHRHDDGSWDSFTGMTYSLDGDGVFNRRDFPVKDGESIHLYGPGRAAGVPIIGGLIMHHEIVAGVIEHKLAFASRWNAYKEFVHPATWTDGFVDSGLPEGCIVQLDPGLDLGRYNLSPAAETIARAMQRYGAVNVDVALGNVLYGEGLYGHPDKSWDGLLTGNDLRCIDP